MRAVLWSIVALLLGAGGVAAQAADRILPSDGPLFATPSQVSWVFGTGEGVDRNVELLLSQHLRVRPRANGDGFEEWLDTGGFRFTMDWSFSIMLRRHTDFRGVETRSSPVRTPSVKWEWAPWPEFRWHLRDGLEDPTSVLLFASGGLNHYSNGQSGCLFEGFARRPADSGECLPEPGVTPPERLVINARDGSFSTNFLEGAVGVEWLQRDQNDVGAIQRGVGARVNLRHALKSDDEDFIARYGRTELAGTAWWRIARTTFGFFGIDVPLVDRDELSGPIILELDGFVRGGGSAMTRTHSGLGLSLKWLTFGGGQWGPFIRAYRGTNYYNINFENTRSVEEVESFVQMGFTWEHGRLRSFATRAALAAAND